MNERLLEALLAMDKLNSFARSQQGAGPRRAIYWLKAHYAIRDAVMAGLCPTMRAVQVTTRCHKCKDGVYHDWGGYSRGQCYTCRGTSKVTLKFIETQIQVPENNNSIPDSSGDVGWIVTYDNPELAPKKTLVWHSPIEYSSWLGWPTEDLTFAEAQDWTVKREGKTLSTVELATAMNIVETFWPWWRKNSPYENSREEWDSHRYFIFNYALDLGYTAPEAGCVLCGRAHSGYCHITVPPGLTQSFAVCAACEKEEQRWNKLKALPLPQLHPEVERWRARHALDFEKTWTRGYSVEWEDRKQG